MSNKVVLEEQEYVDALEHIIERDFFPDLSRLRKTSVALVQHDAATVLRSSARTVTIDTSSASGKRPLQHQCDPIPSSMRNTSPSWDMPTPTHEPLGRELTQRAQTQEHQLAANDEEGSAIEKMTLNRFVATHTSEDNAAFTELQIKAETEHKQRYHWAYEPGEHGDPKFHLLSDGTWISKEQRRLVNQILAPKGSKDERPSQVETWPHRVRNTLLFAPDLETTKAICRVENRGTDALLSLENGSGVHVADKNRILGRPPRGKRETIYANSRFDTTGERPEPFPSTHSDYGRTPLSEYSLVQMTPTIAPGVDASPLMTWGDIEGTPMVLDGRGTIEQSHDGPSFNIKETTTREKVADRLESEARRRKAQRRQRKNDDAPTSGRVFTSPSPNISLKRAYSMSDKPTPMSERAQKLRVRLSGLRAASRTPVLGSDAELRASYSTPLRAPFKRSTDRRSK